MAVSKVILNGNTLIDTTDKTVTAASMLSGITALKNDGTTATGNIASKTSSDLTANNLTVTAPAGYYASAATKTLSDENLVAGNVKKDVTIFGTTGTYEGSGGGYTLNDILSRTEPSGALVISGTDVKDNTLYSNPITSVRMDDTSHEIKESCFRKCTSLTTAFLRIKSTSGSYHLAECSNLVTGVISTVNNPTPGGIFYKCSKLEVADYGLNYIGVYEFTDCPLLTTIILRRTSRVNLANSNALNNTPFKSGGTGGTIYIPETLYNHLGDGTSDDYKANTNWATWDAYGTITWAKIEGTYWATHYGDGTVIT